MYGSILRNLNIPASGLWGSGTNGTPALGGHTVPVFPTIGQSMSHGDDVLNWSLFVEKVTPPPLILSASRLFVPWQTFVDWFYTHPSSANVERTTAYDIPLNVLNDEIMDLYCNDLKVALPQSQGLVDKRFKKLYTFADLKAAGLWERLAKKEALLNYCK
jgi:hypothetical protein